LGGNTFLPENMCMKNLKMPEFYVIFTSKIIKILNFFTFDGKINKIPKFYMLFDRKMSKFYMIIARKLFFPVFYWGGGDEPLSPRLLRLWSICKIEDFQYGGFDLEL